MKQETLEEAAEKYFPSAKKMGGEIYCTYKGFIAGAKWQEQNSYSEEEVVAFGEFIFKHTLLTHAKGVKNLFEQFKNK